MNYLGRLLKDPVRFARLRRWFYVGLVLIVLADVILPRVFPGEHSHFSFERFPAWGSLYGLASCAAIIIVSKIIGKAWLMRREDYYDS